MNARFRLYGRIRVILFVLVAIVLKQRYNSFYLLASPQEEVSLLQSLQRREEITSCNLLQHISDGENNCLQRIALELSRVWEPHRWQSWCTSDQKLQQGQREAASEGLVLIKVPKSASSTVAGIVLRVQDRHNCTVYWKHKLASEYASERTARKKVCRVAPIRDPTSRALSSFFFHRVSFHKQNGQLPRDAVVLHHLQQAPRNYILNYTSPTTLPSTLTTSNDHNVDWKIVMKDLVDAVRETIQWYDFLFVVDRLDESLVVWSWLTGLPHADLISMSTKQGGSWHLSGGRCVSLVKPFRSPAVQAHVQTTGWKRAHAADRLLHAVGTQSLEQTIHESMGQERFARELDNFRRLRGQLRTVCRDEAHFPCSRTGTPQPAKANCYVRDFGCGYPCMDHFLQTKTNMTGS